MEIRTPLRVSRSYVQHLHAPPADVFPLLCPVREAEWVDGWDPVVVYADSGLVEPDCVFVTRAGDDDSIWVVTVHDPASFHVEMLKVTPGVTVCKLVIRLTPEGEGGTAADVTYTHTALGERGRAFIEGFTAAHYLDFMRTWEAELNAFLAGAG